MSTVTIDLSDAEDVKLVRVNKKRLNKPFIPFTVLEDKCLMIDKLIECSAGARRLFRDLLRQCSGVNRVVHHSIKHNEYEDLRMLVSQDMVLRLPVALHPRKRGCITVLVNPHMVLTTDDSMYALWSRGLSTEQQELQH
jgi:hypothetical protein